MADAKVEDSGAKTVPLQLALKLRARQEQAEKSAQEAVETAARAEQRAAVLARHLQESEDRASASAAALARVQSELAERAQNQALQAATVAAAEQAREDALARLAELEAQSAQGETLAQAHAALQADRTVLESRVKELAAALGESRELVASLSHEKAGWTEAHTAEVGNLRDDIARVHRMHEAAMEAQRQDAGKKSLAARRMVSERDGRIRELEAKAKELAETLAQGSPEDRQLTEIARAQAQRDARAQLEAENRDIALHQLQAVVEAKDLELAALAGEATRLRQELDQAQQRHTRGVSGGVNAEYLKNVLVEYLSFPAQSSQRNVLFPVLATLLQFDAGDLRRISQCGTGTTTRGVKDISAHGRRRAQAQTS